MAVVMGKKGPVGLWGYLQLGHSKGTVKWVGGTQGDMAEKRVPQCMPYISFCSLP